VDKVFCVYILANQRHTVLYTTICNAERKETECCHCEERRDEAISIGGARKHEIASLRSQ
jgi:hypothetical protein